MAANKVFTKNPDEASHSAEDYKKSFDPKTPPDSEYAKKKAGTTMNDPLSKKAPRNKG
jgi:hypothetical protein